MCVLMILSGSMLASFSDLALQALGPGLVDGELDGQRVPRVLVGEVGGHAVVVIIFFLIKVWDNEKSNVMLLTFDPRFN